MRYMKEIHPVPQIDALAEVHDQVVIRIEKRGEKEYVYVDVSDITVLRIGNLSQPIEVADTRHQPIVTDDILAEAMRRTQKQFPDMATRDAVEVGTFYHQQIEVLARGR